jgi:geranylgeranyl reductase family protein
MKIMDVIIVGAGPAGTIAGYHLAQSGLDVLIIEKSSFPRRKVCGGGLTQRAYQELPFKIEPVIHRTINCGMVGFAGRLVTTIHQDEPVAYLIDRPSFDAFLLQKAISQGVQCHQDERALTVKQENDIIHLQTDRASYQSRYLIGADGIHSQVAKAVGLLRNRSISLAYEAHLAYPSGKIDPLIESITFDFGTLLGGYGWIFPKRDHLNVGVFRSWPDKHTTKKQLMRFIHQHPALSQARILNLRAFPVPQSGATSSLHQGHVLLCGDAANLADPWLGEGLYYAVTSGRMAAESIKGYAQSDHRDLSVYSDAIADAFDAQFKYAKRISLLVNTLPYVNVQLLKAGPRLQDMVVDLLRGARSHQEIWQDLKTSLPNLISKLFPKKNIN